MGRQQIIRPCSVCGLFYPRQPEALRREIAGLLADHTAGEDRGEVRALIAPHAGYRYSGATAASGYGLLRGRSYATVVVVAPSHREYFDGVSVYDGDAYATPLGLVPIDAALRSALLSATDLVRASSEGHGEEHAIEVQLPFLQFLLPPFALLPVVIGDQRGGYCTELGHALGRILAGTDSLLVASSDLSHYHPAGAAEKLDTVVAGDVARLDPPALLRHLEQGAGEACGGGPVVAVMTALRDLGFDSMTVLHRCASGDITGDHSSVVGYFSAAAVS